MTSTTPKPRAGEHTFDIPKHMERNRLDAYDALLAERDALAAQKRELRDGLAKSVQYIQQLASMVNTLKPRGVHAEDFTEHAQILLQRIK